MTRDALLIAYNASLYILLPLGLLAMLWWCWKIVWPVIARRLDNGVSIDGLIGIIFWTMLPGLALFVLFSVPAIYIGKQLSQEDYCRGLIRVSDLKADDPLVRKRCALWDIEALMSEE
ncbi:hypothetical protein A6D6_01725 [Alcanivorax xiamenensis]|uniref:Uncharacterized protein n=1 Tax=Alcanivorax xiamenensis TaxID=1177156 RepID=A0ABQ6Y8Y4_9GAMM|nr:MULTISPECIES: hypothetical protein [Alcanivorax]KAF0806145.1 hypothetical protein A6D6_01725 [Alcanivorax xiamenensis]